jgi:DtxR family Mn-dependent transcriptional regulator
MTDQECVTPTVEEYLEAILNMIAEGRTVLGARLAERLQVSPPTVTATLGRMRRDGLLVSGEGNGIILTDKGTKLAISVVRRHRLAERWLTDFLKIPWSQVHHEACLLEHGISERVMNDLYDALGKPATCPHGNPIPAGDVLPPLQGVPLDTLDAGMSATVERISEEANRLPELMKYLENAGLRPGAGVAVEEVAHYAGTMTIRVDGKPVSLGTKVASMVWVTP